MNVDVCVIGLGYIGLPTAVMFARHGYSVLGVDVKEEVLEKILADGGPAEEPALASLVKGALSDGSLCLGGKPEPADVFILCLPTPLREDKKADLSFVENGMESILPFIKKGDMVILESTVPPGTTEGLIAEMVRGKGFDPCGDLDLVFAPERVMPSNILEELENLDRVMGGLTPGAAERARDLYAAFVKGRIVLTDATTAEFVKLVENSYRDVNIAFANELAVLAMGFGIDIWEAVTIANRHPRVNILYPGPGVGGHCIAVDPYFIIEKSGGSARLMAEARRVNDSMPENVVGEAERLVGDLNGRKVAVLGIAYKGNVGDFRQSPSLSIIERLEERGAVWKAHDPHVTSSPVPLVSVEEALEGADLIIVATDHNVFLELDPDELGEKVSARKILDTRHILKRSEWESAGWEFQYLGDGKRV